MILESKLSYRFLRNIIAVHILFSFLSVCACTIEPEHKDGPYGFHWEGFGITLLVITLVMLIFFVVIFLSKKLISIDSEAGTMSVHPVYSSKGRSYSLNEITAMDWENKNRSYGTRYSSQVSLHQQSFSISFKSGYLLTIEGTDFSNFQEIQSFFFNYCQRHGIIHIAPLEERKKSILRRARH